MCLEKDQQFSCNKNKTVIGPINFHQDYKEDGIGQNLVFFMANRDELDTDQFEFHKSKHGHELQNKKSYIYVIATLSSAHVSQVEQFIEDDVMLPELGLGQDSAVETEQLAYQFTKSRDKQDLLAQKLRIDNFRFQLSLGTEIESITPIIG